MDPRETLRQRTQDLLGPLTLLLTSKDPHTFDLRYDAFEEAGKAWKTAMQAMDFSNPTHLPLAAGIVAMLKPHLEDVSTLAAKLGATKGVSEPNQRAIGARRIRSKTGRRVRRGTRRGQKVRS